jgi:hypothetical protein
MTVSVDAHAASRHPPKPDDHADAALQAEDFYRHKNAQEATKKEC